MTMYSLLGKHMVESMSFMESKFKEQVCDKTNNYVIGSTTTKNWQNYDNVENKKERNRGRSNYERSTTISIGCGWLDNQAWHKVRKFSMKSYYLISSYTYELEPPSSLHFHKISCSVLTPKMELVLQLLNQAKIEN
jgi:hypothetical protein